MKTPAHHRSLRAFPGTLAILSSVLLALVPFHAVQADEVAEKKAATDAMFSWLKTIDEDDYVGSYEAASALFKKKVTREQWTAALEQTRKPLGAVKSRTLASAALLDGLPDGTKGTFVLAQFNSEFANLAHAIETVTFEREAGGAWRASGYFIRPR